MKTTKLTLTLDIIYISNGVPVEELKKNMAQFVFDGMSNGVFTADSPAEIDTHYYEIKQS